MVKFTFVFIDDFDVNIPELIGFDEIKLKSNELKNGYIYVLNNSIKTNLFIKRFELKRKFVDKSKIQQVR